MGWKVFSALLSAAALAGCQDDVSPIANGYAEGEYVFVAAPEGGWVAQLHVARGAQVSVGDALFTLDTEAQVAQRAQAAAQVAQAQSQLANLQKGRRPDEIAAIEASLLQARANLTLAEADLKRANGLKQRGFVSQSVIDAKQAQHDAGTQQVKQITANLALARKGARADELAAAQANVDAAKAALARSEYALNQRRIVAKVAGRVEDTLRRAGEFVQAGGAVVQLLPPGNIKVRFFVPEASRSKLGVGREVAIGCDGCEKGLKARVTFIASSAEFTPPVIYSVGSREKLVWMVEAVPTGPARLSPGQPVDVTLP